MGQPAPFITPTLGWGGRWWIKGVQSLHMKCVDTGMSEDHNSAIHVLKIEDNLEVLKIFF